MLEVFINAIIATVVNLIIWRKILNEWANFSSVRTYIGLGLMIVCLMANSIMVEPISKTIIILFITLFTLKIIYKIDLKEAIILSIITQLNYIISEVVVIMFVLLVTNIQSNKELVNVFFGTIYANITISSLVVIIMQFPFVKNIYNKLVSIIQKQKVFNIFVTVFTIITMASVIFNFIFYQNNLLLLSCIGLVLLLFYLGFVINSVTLSNKYLNMHIRYNNTLETLKSYEDILDKYKVSNHENKNQLLMIRNMLKKDTKNDVSKYIDKIVDNEYKDDENLMMETSKIPSGGLRALIYSKILYMKNNNITFDIDFDRKIRNVKFDGLDESIVLDICKIVGVFLDNAIEAISETQAGRVNISLYMLENQLHISIANTFDGAINLDKIDEVKYTTKGEGHGYGLALVKEIVNKHSFLENVKMINDNVFIQILKIDI